jgi:lipopolysaccharide transport system permease protein
MLAFSVIFGRLIGVSSDGIPYPLFVYAGLLPWTFFAASVNRSAVSLVSNASLVSKVYFPRLIVPVGAVLANALDFGVAFVILLVMMVAFGIAPTVAMFALPCVLLLALMAAVGVGLWLSALNVKYRDVAHVLPFLMQFWFFLSPVAYPSAIVPQPWQAVYGLNPMAIVVEAFRWSMLGVPGPSTGLSVVSLAFLLTLFCSGILYFNHAEDEFADVV